VRAPEIAISAVADAPARSFRIAIAGIGAGGGIVPESDAWIAATSAEVAALGIAGVTHDRSDGQPRLWVDDRARARAAEAGYATGAPLDFVAAELALALRAEAAEFVGVQETRELADELEATHPALVQEVAPRLVSVAQVADVLRRLVREGVSIRDLRSVFEALAIGAAFERDPAALAESVRAQLRRQLTEHATGGRPSLPVYLLSAELEVAFREAVAAGQGLDWVPLEPAAALSLLDAVRSLEAAPRPAGARRPVVLVPREIRRAVRAVIETEMPRVPVFAYQELLPAVALLPAGTLGASPNGSPT
jgi:type III secretory pathway component EscV